MIGIIDYGAGNLYSVAKAFRYLGFPVRIVSSPEDMAGVKKLVLPGVGHFETAMVHLCESELENVIRGWLAADRPFLGICLGMQLLFSTSEESRKPVAGFTFFSGDIRRFQGRRTLHVGWNGLQAVGPSTLLKNIEPEAYFYFVHRYYAESESPGPIVAYSDFSGPFISVIQRGNIWGVQFHPEKSGESGLRLLQNWREIC